VLRPPHSRDFYPLVLVQEGQPDNDMQAASTPAASTPAAAAVVVVAAAADDLA